MTVFIMKNSTDALSVFYTSGRKFVFYVLHKNIPKLFSFPGLRCYNLHTLSIEFAMLLTTMTITSMSIAVCITKESLQQMEQIRLNCHHMVMCNNVMLLYLGKEYYIKVFFGYPSKQSHSTAANTSP